MAGRCEAGGLAQFLSYLRQWVAIEIARMIFHILLSPNERLRDVEGVCRHPLVESIVAQYA